MKLHGKQFIGYEISAETNKNFYAINPVTNDRLECSFSEASPEEIHRACLLAQNAFFEFKNLSVDKRAEFLTTIAEEIENLGDSLIERVQLETALPKARIIGERGRTQFQLSSFASHIAAKNHLGLSIDSALPQRKPLPKPDLRKINIPLGSVAVFGASNFPLAYSTAGGDVASALAAGCPVIVKAHPSHPGTSELVAGAIIKAAKKCSMPEGCFSMVHGLSHEVSLNLIEHPAISAVGFTGSQQGGLALAKAAAARPVPIPVYAEMGSSNPVFILPETLGESLDPFAEGYFQSLNLGVGQFCTNPGILICLRSQHSQKLLDLLEEKAVKLEPGCMVSPSVKKGYISALKKKLSQNNVVLSNTSENRTIDDADEHSHNNVTSYILKTKGTEFLSNPELGAEIFGPSALVVECETLEEMADIAKNIEGQLTCSLWAQDKEQAEAQKFIQILNEKAGRLILNGFPTGVEVCPSMVHGGPYPATTTPKYSAVGTEAITRFLRPVCYQSFPQDLLPAELRDENPEQLLRLVNGAWTREPLGKLEKTM